MTHQDGLPKKGEILAGKYQVEEVLGAGGMGVVVAARHIALRQRVALKFLLPAATQFPGAAARFLREAQAAVAIQSEHVARVLDVGTLESGAPYMVMEHLSGVDLARHMKSVGPLAVEEAVDFVLQASEALVEAHGLGIVHRDLKPANLFLARRPEGSALVKVLDFGLSKMAPSEEGIPEASLTAANVVAGSPHYMSPEQVRSLKHVDARTDVWALGVILYELLTGKRPFEGPTVTAVCAGVVADVPASARSHRGDLPLALDAVLFACLEKDPKRRLATVADLAAALAPFAAKRSESSIERIRRLQAVTGDRADGAKTVPLMWPPLLAPATPVPPVLPRVVVGATAASPAQGAPRAVETQRLPWVEPVVGAFGGAAVGSAAARAGEPVASAGGPLPLASAVPGIIEAATGANGWANTQPPVKRQRKGIVLAGAGLGLLVCASVVGFVALRAPAEPAVVGASAVALTASQGEVSAPTASALPAPSVPDSPSQSVSAMASSLSQGVGQVVGAVSSPTSPVPTASASARPVASASAGVKAQPPASAGQRPPQPPTATPVISPSQKASPDPLDIKN